jgi:hypothetical protein
MVLYHNRQIFREVLPGVPKVVVYTDEEIVVARETARVLNAAQVA